MGKKTIELSEENIALLQRITETYPFDIKGRKSIFTIARNIQEIDKAVSEAKDAERIDPAKKLEVIGSPKEDVE